MVSSAPVFNVFFVYLLVFLNNFLVIFVFVYIFLFTYLLVYIFVCLQIRIMTVEDRAVAGITGAIRNTIGRG